MLAQLRPSFRRLSAKAIVRSRMAIGYRLPRPAWRPSSTRRRTIASGFVVPVREHDPMARHDGIEREVTIDALAVQPNSWSLRTDLSSGLRARRRRNTAATPAPNATRSTAVFFGLPASTQPHPFEPPPAGPLAPASPAPSPPAPPLEDPPRPASESERRDGPPLEEPLPPDDATPPDDPPLPEDDPPLEEAPPLEDPPPLDDPLPAPPPLPAASLPPASAPVPAAPPVAVRCNSAGSDQGLVNDREPLLALARVV